jgi:hypothetical protein
MLYDGLRPCREHLKARRGCSSCQSHVSIVNITMSTLFTQAFMSAASSQLRSPLLAVRDAEQHKLIAVRCDSGVRLKRVAAPGHQLCTAAATAAVLGRTMAEQKTQRAMRHASNVSDASGKHILSCLMTSNSFIRSSSTKRRQRNHKLQCSNTSSPRHAPACNRPKQQALTLHA